MKKQTVKLSVCALTLLITHNAYADTTNDILREQDDKRIQNVQNPAPSILPILPDMTMPPKAAADEQTATLSEQQFLQQPQLVVRALSSALLFHQSDDVAFLLPYYEKLTQDTDDFVKSWAKGVIAEQQGDIKQAIKQYSNAVAKRDDIAMLRLRLALMLMFDKQYKQAQSHFDWISKQSLPEQILISVDKYRQMIAGQQRVQLGSNVNFLNDKNINNAPKNQDLGGGWTAPAPQSARGFGYAVDVQKKWFLDSGFYADTRGDVWGKYYWDNKRYNEITARISAGVGYQNAKSNIVILPFVERSYYATDNNNGSLDFFSKSHGVAVEGGHWLRPDWRLGAYAQIAKQDYARRNHLDGHSYYSSVSQTYFSNPNRYWYASLDYQRNKAQDADDSFVKKGVKAGVGQTWQNGLSLRSTVSYAKKDYQGVGFFGVKQRNTEYGIATSIGHNKIQWHGITPKLTWQYQKTDSNLPLYRYDRNYVFIEVGRAF